MKVRVVKLSVLIGNANQNKEGYVDRCIKQSESGSKTSGTKTRVENDKTRQSRYSAYDEGTKSSITTERAKSNNRE